MPPGICSDSVLLHASLVSKVVHPISPCIASFGIFLLAPDASLSRLTVLFLAVNTCTALTKKLFLAGLFPCFCKKFCQTVLCLRDSFTAWMGHMIYSLLPNFSFLFFRQLLQTRFWRKWSVLTHPFVSAVVQRKASFHTTTQYYMRIGWHPPKSVLMPTRYISKKHACNCTELPSKPF